MASEPVVYVVDDDEAIRHSLGLLFRSVDLAVRAFGDPEALLEALDPGCRGCVVADLEMPQMSGLELQDRIAGSGVRLPIIFLTGHGDVPAAVRALKHGALDFLEKPFDPVSLIERVRQAIATDGARHAERESGRALDRLVASLTPREREITNLVALGKSSKVIAAELAISERTVELHRGRVLRKMGVRSVAELVAKLAPITIGPSREGTTL